MYITYKSANKKNSFKEICFIHKTKHYQLQKLLKTPTMLLYSLSRGKKKNQKSY